MRRFVHQSNAQTIFVHDEVPGSLARRTFCSGSNIKLDKNEDLIVAMQPPKETVTGE